jgi:acetylxylan esterase
MQYITIAILLPLGALAQNVPAVQLQPGAASPPAIQTSLPEVALVPAPASPITPNAPNGGASAAQQCAPVHIIVARASGEAPGEGTIASLSTLLKQQIPGATSEALVYPAKMPYSGSIPVGVTNMKAAIAKYTSACPTGKLVLLGYSQGGAVLTDTLCGGGGPQVGPATPGLTAAEGKLLKAAVSMGDPRFVPGAPYDAGTNKNKGGVRLNNSFICGRHD